MIFSLKILLILIFISLQGAFLQSYALEEENNKFKGYITNKFYTPIKLKIFEIDKDSLYSIERNLENNSFVPYLNLKVTAQNTSDYSIQLSDSKIYVPKETKFVGSISQIVPPKKFNKRGFYKVLFEKVICPDGKEIQLMTNITSNNEAKIYNPFRHIGKTTLSLIGGSLAGTLFTYELGGLGLTLATHGYSLALGAAAGGFIGTVAGVISEGKSATIEPGSDLIISPVDEASLNELKQISCNKPAQKEEEINISDNNINLEILSLKKKKDWSGETLFKIDILFTNNSDEAYKSTNFYLRDSQGNEYTSTLTNLAEENIFQEFPPKESKKYNLEFFVDYPGTNHWLVLKSKDFTKELGVWKLKD